jgi:hypothetical protein
VTISAPAWFIVCRPVDWSQVAPFLPDRPPLPIDVASVEATCALCDLAVWMDPLQQARRPFGPVICTLCALFTIAGFPQTQKE